MWEGAFYFLDTCRRKAEYKTGTTCTDRLFIYEEGHFVYETCIIATR